MSQYPGKPFTNNSLFRGSIVLCSHQTDVFTNAHFRSLLNFNYNVTSRALKIYARILVSTIHFPEDFM